MPKFIHKVIHKCKYYTREKFVFSYTKRLWDCVGWEEKIKNRVFFVFLFSLFHHMSRWANQQKQKIFLKKITSQHYCIYIWILKNYIKYLQILHGFNNIKISDAEVLIMISPSLFDISFQNISFQSHKNSQQKSMFLPSKTLYSQEIFSQSYTS